MAATASHVLEFLSQLRNEVEVAEAKAASAQDANQKIVDRIHSLETATSQQRRNIASLQMREPNFKAEAVTILTQVESARRFHDCLIRQLVSIDKRKEENDKAINDVIDRFLSTGEGYRDKVRSVADRLQTKKLSHLEANLAVTERTQSELSEQLSSKRRALDTVLGQLNSRNKNIKERAAQLLAKEVSNRRLEAECRKRQADITAVGEDLESLKSLAGSLQQENAIMHNELRNLAHAKNANFVSNSSNNNNSKNTSKDGHHTAAAGPTVKVNAASGKRRQGERSSGNNSSSSSSSSGGGGGGSTTNPYAQQSQQRTGVTPPSQLIMPKAKRLTDGHGHLVADDFYRLANGNADDDDDDDGVDDIDIPGESPPSDEDDLDDVDFDELVIVTKSGSHGNHRGGGGGGGGGGGVSYSNKKTKHDEKSSQDRGTLHYHQDSTMRGASASGGGGGGGDNGGGNGQSGRDGWGKVDYGGRTHSAQSSSSGWRGPAL